MGVAVDQTNHLKVEVVKRAIGNPSYLWRNTYEFNVTAAITAAEATALGLEMIDIERPFHTPNVEFVKAVVSSWEPEVPGEAYDPTTFVVALAGNLFGTKAVQGEVLARHLTLLVRRSAAFGHNGKLAYRGCLGEGDMEGSNTLDLRMLGASKTTFQGLLNTAYTAMQAAIVSAGGAGSTLGLIRIRETPGQPDSIETRPVDALVVDKIRVVSPDHRYFDRAA